MENLAVANRVPRGKENALALPPKVLPSEKRPPDKATTGLPRRTSQQTTADFVQRTERSVARHMKQQTTKPAGPARNGRLRSASSSSQASYASQMSPSQASHTARATQFSTTTTISKVAGRPPRWLQNDPFAPAFLWQRPAMVKIARRPRRAPGALFAALPGDVLERILDHLRQLHLAEGSTSCATCWMRDACAMAVTARKMLKYARAALYEHVELVGVDSARQQKAMKPLQHGTRLVLLRRTLRDNPALAAIVRTLKVPCLDATGALIAATDTAYQDLVASVVMACPKLERVVGFYPPYDHTTHSRFFDALARRVRLREINWILAPASEQPRQRKQQRNGTENGNGNGNGHVRNRSRSRSFSQIIWPQTPPASPGCDKEAVVIATFSTALPSSPPSPSSAWSSFSPPPPPLPPPPLDAQQCRRFLGHHTHWPYLTTMTVHCQPGATLAPNTLLVDALACLPALRNLHLAHLPADAFNDATLLSLPPLRRLTLVGLPGVTSGGLSAYASQTGAAAQAVPHGRALTVLTLVHMRVDALTALARILSKLTALRTFSLVQVQPPTMAPDEAIWLFPYLASPSLRALHWDVPTMRTGSADGVGDRATIADVVVARSIAAGGFPQLRRLRAPADPDGLFQSLCRPCACIALPGDRPEEREGPAVAAAAAAAAAAAPAAAAAAPAAVRGRDERPRRLKHRRSASTSASSSSRSFLSSSLGGHVRTGSMVTTSSSSSGSSSSSSAVAPKLYSDLREARLAAQARLEAARRIPRFLVRVTDEDGRLTDKFGLGGFLGTTLSPIVYDLLPDPGASDSKGGLVDLEAFVDPAGEWLGGVGGVGGVGKDGEAARPQGCTGQWNVGWDVTQKQNRDRWWHTERGRWYGAKLI